MNLLDLPDAPKKQGGLLDLPDFDAKSYATQRAKELGIDPEIAHSVIQTESNWDHSARGKSGELGLMQLMPGTAKEMGVANPLDPKQNIDGGLGYLKKKLDQYGGDYQKALGAYNGSGPNGDYAKKVLGQRYKQGGSTGLQRVGDLLSYNFYRGLENLNKPLSELADMIGGERPPDAMFKKAYMSAQQSAEAAKERLGGEEPGPWENVVPQTIGGFPSFAAEWTAGVPWAAFSGLMAGKEQGLLPAVTNMAKSALERYALGKLFEFTGPAKVELGQPKPLGALEAQTASASDVASSFVKQVAGAGLAGAMGPALNAPLEGRMPSITELATAASQMGLLRAAGGLVGPRATTVREPRLTPEAEIKRAAMEQVREELGPPDEVLRAVKQGPRWNEKDIPKSKKEGLAETALPKWDELSEEAKERVRYTTEKWLQQGMSEADISRQMQALYGVDLDIIREGRVEPPAPRTVEDLTPEQKATVVEEEKLSEQDALMQRAFGVEKNNKKAADAAAVHWSNRTGTELQAFQDADGKYRLAPRPAPGTVFEEVRSPVEQTDVPRTIDMIEESAVPTAGPPTPVQAEVLPPPPSVGGPKKMKDVTEKLVPETGRKETGKVAPKILSREQAVTQAVNMTRLLKQPHSIRYNGETSGYEVVKGDLGEFGGTVIFGDAAEAIGRWTSKMYEALSKKLPGAMTGPQFLDLMKSWAGKEFKKEEWEDTLRLANLGGWLKEREGKKFSKQELLEWLQVNGIKVEEVVRGSAFNSQQWKEYDNYRSMVLGTYGTVEALWPEGVEKKLDELRYKMNAYKPDAEAKYAGSWQLPGGEYYVELVLTSPQARELSGDTSHFEEGAGLRNIGWIRGKVYTAADGKKYFHIDEVQSKRHQESKKARDAKIERLMQDGLSRAEAEARVPEGFGYDVDPAKIKEYDDLLSIGMFSRTEEQRQRVYELEQELNLTGSTPDAPFRKTWPTLLLKRAVKWAAERGYDGVTWSTGEQQVARNNQELRKITHAKYFADEGVVRVEADGIPLTALDQAQEAELRHLLGPRAAELPNGIDLSANPLTLPSKSARGNLRFYGSMGEEGDWTPGILSRSMKDAVQGMGLKEEIIKGPTPTGVASPSPSKWSVQPGITFSETGPGSRQALASNPTYLYSGLGWLPEALKLLGPKALNEMEAEIGRALHKGGTQAFSWLRKKLNAAEDVRSIHYIYSYNSGGSYHSKRDTGLLDASQIALRWAKEVPDVKGRMNISLARAGLDRKLSEAGKQQLTEVNEIYDKYRKMAEDRGMSLEHAHDTYITTMIYKDPHGNPFDRTSPTRRRQDPTKSIVEYIQDGYEGELDSAVIIPTYMAHMEDLFARIDLVDEHLNHNMADGRPVLRTGNLLPKDKESREQFVRIPFSTRVQQLSKYAKIKDPEIAKAMKSIRRAGTDLYAHRDVFETLNSIFTDPMDAHWALISRMQGAVRQVRMYNPLFHTWNIANQSLGGLGLDAYKLLWKPEELQTEQGVFDVSRRFVAAGGRLEGLYNSRRAFTQDIYTNRFTDTSFKPKDIIDNPSAVARHPFQYLADANMYFVFDKAVKTAQLVSFLIKEQRYKDPKYGLSAQEATKLAAHDANNLVGTLQPYYFSRQQRQWLRFLLFARDWNVATARQVLGSLPYAEAMQSWLPKFLRNEGVNGAQWKALTHENRMYVFRSVVGAIATANIVQMAMQAANGKDVHTTYWNEKGHELDADTGDVDLDGKPIYLRMIFRNVDDYIRLATEPVKTAWGKGEPILTTAVNILRSKDSLGKPIWGEEAGYTTVGENLAQIAKQIINLFPWKDFYGPFDPTKTKLEALAPFIGTSVRHGFSQDKIVGDVYKDYLTYYKVHQRLSREASTEIRDMRKGGYDDEADVRMVELLQQGLISKQEFQKLARGRQDYILQKILTRRHLQRNFTNFLNDDPRRDEFLGRLGELFTNGRD